MKIEVSCPQCGGRIDFDEKSFVIRCDFCGSTLHLVGKDQVCHFRLKPRHDHRKASAYLSALLQKKLGPDVSVLKIKLVYAPYWRIHGMVFRWIFGKKLVKVVSASPFGSYREDTKKLLTKLLDLSFPAFQGISLGMQSLGVRTSALPLFIFGNVSEEPDVAFIRVDTDFDYAVKYMNAFVNVGLESEDVEPELEDTQEVGEQYSIIYVPFWLAKIAARNTKQIIAMDAISGSSVKRFTGEEIKTLKKMLEGAGNSSDLPVLRFIPFRCPDCGWELPFYPYNSVHICSTCGRGWFEFGGKFRRVNYRIAEAPSKANKNNVIFLPFWRIKMTVAMPDGTVKSIPQLIGRGYQPYRKSLLDSGEDMLTNFMIPAFRIKNINAFNKIASRLTANPVKYRFEESADPGSRSFGGVNLTYSEAEEMARVVLLSLIPPFARKALQELKDADFKFSNHELIYLPFREEGLFLRDLYSGFSIQKGAVSFGKVNS